MEDVLPIDRLITYKATTFNSNPSDSEREKETEETRVRSLTANCFLGPHQSIPNFGPMGSLTLTLSRKTTMLASLLKTSKIVTTLVKKFKEKSLFCK